MNIRYKKFTYGFDLELTGKGRGYRIKNDCLEKEMEFPAARSTGRLGNSGEKVRTGRSTLCNHGGKIGYRLHVPRDIKLTADEIIPPFLNEEKLPPLFVWVEGGTDARFFDAVLKTLLGKKYNRVVIRGPTPA